MSAMWGVAAQVGLLLIKWFVTDQSDKAKAQQSWEEWLLWAQTKSSLSAQTRTSYQSQLEELRAKHAAAQSSPEPTEPKT